MGYLMTLNQCQTISRVYMSEKKTALTVRIDDDLLQAFKKACDDLDYSQSLVIRELIKKWLADRKQQDLFK